MQFIRRFKSHSQEISQMKRRDFLSAALAAGPAAVVAAGDDSKPKRSDKAVRVAAGEDRYGEKIVLPGGSPNICKVSAKDTDGAMSVFESTLKQKGGPPAHVHDDQDEWFHVLEGEFDFQVGEDRFRLKVGDSVLAPRKVAHAWASLGNKPGKLLIVFQPAGKMEAFFRALGEQKERPARPVMEKLFLDHGMKIVGPPLKID
jgi:quercetin dioxygenase-like cupin family protein